MPRLVILAATDKEAEHTIKELKAKRSLNDSSEYDFHLGKIIITGMGSLQALSKVLQVAQCGDYLLNAGVVGALYNTVEVEHS